MPSFAAGGCLAGAVGRILRAMNRRLFFTSMGAFAVAPLVGAPLLGCEGRDQAPAGGGDDFAAAMASFRAFVVPTGVEASLAFHPLRMKRPG